MKYCTFSLLEAACPGEEEKNRGAGWASRGQAHCSKIDGVDLSGQSMFMLLIRRIPPVLTGEMMRDLTVVERRAQSTTAAKTNEFPDSSRDYHIIVPLPRIDLHLLHFNKEPTWGATWSYILSGLFLELKNSLESSLGPKNISKKLDHPEKYVDMGPVWLISSMFQNNWWHLDNY